MSAFVDSLKELMCDTITMESRLGQSQDGVPTFASPISAKAHVSYKPTRFISSNGTLVTARGKIWVAAYVPEFNGEGKMTLPGGDNPTILTVGLMRDENGPSHMEILFG